MFHDNWPHGTGHSPHMPITQNIAWVAYQALTTPWGLQPYAETCRGRKIWNVLIKKIHHHLEHLLVSSQTIEHSSLINPDSILLLYTLYNVQLFVWVRNCGLSSKSHRPNRYIVFTWEPIKIFSFTKMCRLNIYPYIIWQRSQRQSQAGSITSLPEVASFNHTNIVCQLLKCLGVLSE
jgi:hypothetical protein